MDPSGSDQIMIETQDYSDASPALNEATNPSPAEKEKNNEVNHPSFVETEKTALNEVTQTSPAEDNTSVLNEVTHPLSAGNNNNSVE